ncbi:hypothetical protein [Vandammella animalimorsus]|uniref:Uncharacterized protein n=1 Tax=Vandammella animalimorsus TaxID=2029117 RepID=A0A2A2ABI0_9BURK|nr:hypothetical protein [Vandammella animalimorsus]PAT34939.1 hypothetical protein CK625_12525 [Vandammella animalimorsus]
MSLTNKQLAGYQRRTLHKFRDALHMMAEAWANRDEFNRSQLNDLARQVDGLAAELTVDEEPEL